MFKNQNSRCNNHNAAATIGATAAVKTTRARASVKTATTAVTTVATASVTTTPARKEFG